MDEMRLVRKTQNTLMVAGEILIMLCGWSIIKMLMYITIDRDYIYILTENELESFVYLVIVFLIVLSIIDGLIRFLVAREAMKIAKGSRIKAGYIISVIIYLLLLVWASIVGIREDSYGRVAESISSFILDTIGNVTLLVILYSCFKLARYRTKNKELLKMGDM